MQAPIPEYTGEQAGAVVAPETAEKPEYTGTQAGAVVEPEQVAPLPEYQELKLVPSLNRKKLSQRLGVSSQGPW